MAKSKKDKSKPKLNLTVREEQRKKLEQMAALEKRSDLAPYGHRGISQSLSSNKVSSLASSYPIFYGLFYGRAKICCKTAQLCATPCES
jgi:hypothetical protein